MGGFQAFSAGVGGAGEDFGVGFNNAMSEALKLRQQQHTEEQDAALNAYRAQALQQQYNLAQQEHALTSRGQDITREGMLQQGWHDLGATKDNQGNYTRSFYNPRTNQTQSFPVGGLPPDSFEAKLGEMKVLEEQGFDPTKAAEIAYKTSGLYRTDPAGLIDEYREYYKQLFEERNITHIPIYGFGTMDISTESGQARAAQAMAEMGTRAASALMRGMYGAYPGQKDMTGWTAGEKREYDAMENNNKQLEALYERMAVAQMQSMFPQPELDANGKPTGRTNMDALQEETFKKIGELHKQTSDKYDEINQRHARAPGQRWSESQFKAAHPNATADQIALAKQQARSAGAQVVP